MSFTILPYEIVIEIIENNLYIKGILNILFTSNTYYNSYSKNMIDKYYKVNRMASTLYDQGYISHAKFLCKKYLSFDKSSLNGISWDWECDDMEQISQTISFFMVIDKFINRPKIKN